MPVELSECEECDCDSRVEVENVVGELEEGGFEVCVAVSEVDGATLLVGVAVVAG